MYERFAQLYDRFMADVDYEGWAAYLCAIFERHGLSGSLRITDAACGTGGLTLPLARAGHILIGADLSGDMLQVAAEKCRGAGLRVPFVCEDMRALQVHRRQDVVNCACDGVNYLTMEEEVRAFFSSALAALKPGGLLCFDVSSRYKLENILAGNCFGEDDEGAAYFWRNAYDEEQRLLEMNLSFFMQEEDGRFVRFRERHIQRAHSREELLRWLEEEGFEQVECWECFTAEEPTEKSERLQFCARKPL